MTLLHIAAYNGDLDVLNFILQNNLIDVNAQHTYARNPVRRDFMFGLAFDDLDDSDDSSEDGDDYCYGYTALQYAYDNNNMDCVKALLVQKDVDVNVQDSHGMTLLHH